MAWVAVTGSGGIWEYDNTATSAGDANGTDALGIRTFTFAGGNTQKTYVSCRKAGETTVRGELSKDYYDAQ
jgi:hypothetical protein